MREKFLLEKSSDTDFSIEESIFGYNLYGFMEAHLARNFGHVAKKAVQAVTGLLARPDSLDT